LRSSRYDNASEGGALVNIPNLEPNDDMDSPMQGFSRTAHDDVVAVEGLDDLFQWASQMVSAEGDSIQVSNGSSRLSRAREQRLKRTLLEVIRKNNERDAEQKFQQEINYLQRRVMALLQIVGEKMEENSTLKQIVTIQYLALLRTNELEAELKHLESMTWYREEAEAERKSLMNALAKLKKERDFLDELLTSVEAENTRLSNMLKHTRSELETLQTRRWWHFIFPWLNKTAQAT
jgi:hypothetical protein